MTVFPKSRLFPQPANGCARKIRATTYAAIFPRFTSLTPSALNGDHCGVIEQPVEHRCSRHRVAGKGLFTTGGKIVILLAGFRCRTAQCCGARTRMGGQSCAAHPTGIYAASSRHPGAEAADGGRLRSGQSTLRNVRNSSTSKGAMPHLNRGRSHNHRRARECTHTGTETHKDTGNCRSRGNCSREL